MGTWVPLGLHPFSNSLPGLGPGTLPGGCGLYPLRPAAQVLKEAEEEGNRVTTRPGAVKHWLGLLGKSRWHRDERRVLETPLLAPHSLSLCSLSLMFNSQQ